MLSHTVFSIVKSIKMVLYYSVYVREPGFSRLLVESAFVFIPLAFGLAVGLGYATISSAWHRRKK
jgi:hypothetical protein